MSAAPEHQFVVIIPVADRPRQLELCLASLLEQKQRFGYPHLSVLIAEDSLAEDSRAAHRQLAGQCSAQGIACHYFGLDEQAQLLKQYAELFTDLPDNLAHKGASTTRNLCLLWLQQSAMDRTNTLCHFIDSDQEFRVRLGSGDSAQLAMPFSYFHELDALFSDPSIRVLTGKVVGDPPVSPAVMAGHMLADLLAFLHEMGKQSPDAPCSFHGDDQQATDAAYHDMADLFGFKPQQVFRYPCSLPQPHDHRTCLNHLSNQLGGFFDGLQPFRATSFQADEPTKPARTLYTGNYVLRLSELWFIPFAALKLRMAGPTFGRLMQAKLGPGFVSANVPMLHKRTLEESAKAEFRAGVALNHSGRDISQESERQFFGDIMLFSMEKLVKQGYPQEQADILSVLEETAGQMLARYQAQHQTIGLGLAKLDALLADTKHWWQGQHDIQQFADDMALNFGDQAAGWKLINDPKHRAERLAQMAAALTCYPHELANWQTVLGNGS